MVLNVATAVTALWAFLWNVFAAYEAPRPFRRIYAATAFYSSFYVGAYLWLIVWPETDRGDWSNALAPVAVSTFLVVFSASAMVSSVARHRTRKQSDGQ